MSKRYLSRTSLETLSLSSFQICKILKVSLAEIVYTHILYTIFESIIQTNSDRWEHRNFIQHFY